MVSVLTDAEPFSFKGNDIGVLVIHGFTGTTQSMRYLGTELHKQFGFTVEGPRLPGHGTSPDDMETTTYLDCSVTSRTCCRILPRGRVRCSSPAFRWVEL